MAQEDWNNFKYITAISDQRGDMIQRRNAVVYQELQADLRERGSQKLSQMWHSNQQKTLKLGYLMKKRNPCQKKNGDSFIYILTTALCYNLQKHLPLCLWYLMLQINNQCPSIFQAFLFTPQHDYCVSASLTRNSSNL